MKKIINYIFILLLVFVVCSCKDTTNKTNNESQIVSSTINKKETTSTIKTTKAFELKNGNYNLIKDLSYNDSYGDTGLYDLYLPIDKNSGDINVVLFIHGGAWITCSKEDYKDSINDFSKYIMGSFDDTTCVASINYRLLNEETPEISIFTMLNDITESIQKIKEYLIQLGYNPKMLIVGGHSAGGHLALLYSYRNYNDSAIPIKFVFSLSGPTDIDFDVYVPIANELLSGYLDEEYIYKLGMLGTETKTKEDAIVKLKDVSPITYVNESTIPTLIFHGNKDEIVPYNDSLKLMEKLNNCNVKAKLLTISNGSHNSSSEYTRMRNYGFLEEFYNFYYDD